MKIKKKWLVLISLTLGSLMIGIDATSLNIALPTLANKLGASSSQLQWFVDGYNLVLAVLLLPAGLIVDRFGQKISIILSFMIFGVASLTCALSTTPEMLIGARFILAVGAALMTPASMSIIPTLFKKDEQQTATTVLVASATIGLPLGPILGGWLLENFNWNSIFYIAVPIAILAIIVTIFLMPNIQNKTKTNIDWLGIILSSIGLGGFTYGVIRASEYSWSDNGVLISLIGGVIIMVIFVAWQLKAKYALIDISLFKDRIFSSSVVLIFMFTFIMFGLIFVLPQFFQNIEGVGPQATGIRLLPLILGLLVAAVLGDKLHLSDRNLVGIGFVFAGIASGLGMLITIRSGYGYVALVSTIAGLGIGLALPKLMGLGLSQLSPNKAGIGSSVLNTFKQVGSTMGVAILGTVLSTTYKHHVKINGLSHHLKDVINEGITQGIAVATKIQKTIIVSKQQLENMFNNHQISSTLYQSKLHQLNSMQNNARDLLHSVKTSFIMGTSQVFLICLVVSVFGVLVTLICMPKNIKN